MDEAERTHSSRTLSNRSLTRPQPGRRPSCPTCRAKLTSDILVVPNYSLQHTIEKYVAALAAIPPTAFHHALDVLAVEADAAGYVRAYIVVPGIIYGRPSGPLFDAGIAKRNMAQVAGFAQMFLLRGRAGVMGTGASIWADIQLTISSISATSSSPPPGKLTAL